MTAIEITAAMCNKFALLLPTIVILKKGSGLLPLCNQFATKWVQLPGVSTGNSTCWAFLSDTPPMVPLDRLQGRHPGTDFHSCFSPLIAEHLSAPPQSASGSIFPRNLFLPSKPEPEACLLHLLETAFSYL